MLNEYPIFKKNEIGKFYNSLSNKDKNRIKLYLEYRESRGINSQEKIKDLKRYMLHLLYIVGNDFWTLDLQKLRRLLIVINKCYLSDYAKNTIKVDLKNYLKYAFPAWSSRFANLDDIKLISKPLRKREINHKKMFKKEDIEKMVRHESRMFWKAFFLVQYEAGLRTVEVRCLKWDDVQLYSDGDLSELNIYSTKTKQNRPVFVKEASFYLQKLKEEQENLKQKGIYIFHSVKDINQPIDKYIVSMWFRSLTEKALGEKKWCYLLRHSRATELYSLADEGKISERTANKFMGHGRDMGEVYRNMSPDKIKEMLKNQVYKLEDLPEKKKHELEKEIENLKMADKKLWEKLEEIAAMARASYEAVLKNGGTDIVLKKDKKYGPIS